MDYTTLTNTDQLRLAQQQLRNIENQHFMTYLTLQGDQAAGSPQELLDRLTEDLADLEAKAARVKDIIAVAEAAVEQEETEDGS